MSCLRTINRYPLSGMAKRFQSTESIIVPSEDACDLPILIDRVKRGYTPATRVCEYSSMVCSDTSELLNHPPMKINDPTDVPYDELNKVDVTPQDDNQPVDNPKNV